MSFQNNKKKPFLITIIPAWESKKNYTIVRINSIDFKLYNIDFWKYRFIYPPLRVFNFIYNDNFESDLRTILELVQNNHKKTSLTLNNLLE